MALVPASPTIHAYRTDAAWTTSHRYLFVKRNGDSDFDLCGAGELPFGALAEEVVDCSSTARSLPVQDGGRIRVKCGASFNAGVAVMSDGNGKAIAWTTGNAQAGVALSDGADGKVIAITFSPSDD
jgi:hypothetical protein